MIFGELLAVIVLWFFALQIWDIPRLTRNSLSIRGALRFIAGGVVAICAIVLLYVILPASVYDALSALAISTFLAALAAEFIVGEDVRRFILRRR